MQAKESQTSTRTSPATIQPSGLSPAHRTPARQLVKAAPSRFGNTIQLGKKKSKLEVAIDRQKRQSEDGDEIAWNTIKTNWTTMQLDNNYPFTLKEGEPGKGGGQYFFEFSKDEYNGHVSVSAEETKCFHLTLTAPKKDKGNYYFYFKGRAVKSVDPKTKSSYPFSQLPSDFKDDATTLVRDLFL
ncbi:MAG: hypothetical protein M3348_06215 [Acidobacteriota bacterium]|nr:hypothetical protein [Acidobacteriota bacterium]